MAKCLKFVFLFLTMESASNNNSPPKWMADLEKDDINLLQGKLSDNRKRCSYIAGLHICIHCFKIITLWKHFHIQENARVSYLDIQRKVYLITFFQKKFCYLF